MLVGLIAPWVVGAATVEDIAATVAALVLRNTFLVAEAKNADNEFRSKRQGVRGERIDMRNVR